MLHTVHLGVPSASFSSPLQIRRGGGLQEHNSQLPSAGLGAIHAGAHPNSGCGPKAGNTTQGAFSWVGAAIEMPRLGCGADVSRAVLAPLQHPKPGLRPGSREGSQLFPLPHTTELAALHSHQGA